jgi:subtilisin family serine protease
LVLSLVVAGSAQEPTEWPKRITIPTQTLPGVASKGDAALDKLDLTLRLFYQRVTAARRNGTGAALRSPEVLATVPGAVAGPAGITVATAIKMEAPDGNYRPLQAAGAVIDGVVGTTVYATVRVEDLPNVAALPEVTDIHCAAPAGPPEPPGFGIPRMHGLVAKGGVPEETFDHQGLSGKGVVVGVFDSGIDFRHADFRNADGTTRLLALWDQTDDSWHTSGGKVGHRPPHFDDNTPPVGTLYLREDLDAALRGDGQVHSVDTIGHGTACAGVAAGNGRAAAGGPDAGVGVGVAPRADLLVVKWDKDKERPEAPAIGWMRDYARSLGKPCVVNCSFGGHFGPHDGSTDQEKDIDGLLGANAPGFAVVAAAGNNGQHNMHATLHFGPKTQFEPDVESDLMEFVVLRKQGVLTCWFNHEDSWSLLVTGLQEPFLDGAGKRYVVGLRRHDDRFQAAYGGIEGGDISQARIERLAHVVGSDNARCYDGRLDECAFVLPAGRYAVQVNGDGPHVPDGKADFYFLDGHMGTFAVGSAQRELVSAPATAAHVIAVGSYDYRASWDNAADAVTTFKLVLGQISDYSCPGYRRDGVVKPDVLAPGQFALAALARHDGTPAELAGEDEEGRHRLITRDKQHVAFSGTSAAAPFVTGVVALMLEKNPTLDADAIRGILTSTAHQDDATGAVPNARAGYGKVEPEAALAKTPAKSAG